MKVQELLDLLGDFDPDAEVRLAQQPSWAFEYSIGDVVADEGHQHDIVKDGGSPWFCDDRDCGKEWDHAPMDYEVGDDDATGIVYIGEGSQLAYLPASAQDALGWRRS